MNKKYNLSTFRAEVVSSEGPGDFLLMSLRVDPCEQRPRSRPSHKPGTAEVGTGTCSGFGRRTAPSVRTRQAQKAHGAVPPPTLGQSDASPPSRPRCAVTCGRAPGRGSRGGAGLCSAGTGSGAGFPADRHPTEVRALSSARPRGGGETEKGGWGEAPGGPQSPPLYPQGSASLAARLHRSASPSAAPRPLCPSLAGTWPGTASRSPALLPAQRPPAPGEAPRLHGESLPGTALRHRPVDARRLSPSRAPTEQVPPAGTAPALLPPGASPGDPGPVPVPVPAGGCGRAAWAGRALPPRCLP